MDITSSCSKAQYTSCQIALLITTKCKYCTARQCLSFRRKFMECSIINPALSLLMKHLVIGQRQKTPNFLAFHWSPQRSLISIGQHLVTTRVVHLPKRTKTSLITESDQSGPNHHLLQLCTAHTAWSDLDLAVGAVHSCNSWFCFEIMYMLFFCDSFICIFKELKQYSAFS